MNLGLKDQVALVTAASKGLGKAAALALAEEGARIAICARSDALETTADEIRNQTGSEVLALRTDLTNPAQIDALVQGTLDKFEKIDILIINAGGPRPGGFLDLTIEQWEEGINLTIMSAVRLCYAVVPHMVARRSGSIVATESYSIKNPIADLILSNSLRLAVIGMMKSMADELGQKGIRVNSINPFWTRTERVDQVMKDRADRNDTSIEEELSKVAASAPLGRLGTLEEYGRTVAWLASPAASFIHGHALYFDGGANRSPI